MIIPVGIDVFLTSHLNLVLEANLAANDDGEALQSISGGLYFSH
ncbi:MAG: hypothetical protein R3281_04015 [Balneolaceae bacterium]|nr:hypothetical protein [Balneolaceae bacterium]